MADKCFPRSYELALTLNFANFWGLDCREGFIHIHPSIHPSSIHPDRQVGRQAGRQVDRQHKTFSPLWRLGRSRWLYTEDEGCLRGEQDLPCHVKLKQTDNCHNKGLNHRYQTKLNPWIKEIFVINLGLFLLTRCQSILV